MADTSVSISEAQTQMGHLLKIEGCLLSIQKLNRTDIEPSEQVELEALTEYAMKHFCLISEWLEEKGGV